MAVLMLTGNHVFMHYMGDDGVGAFGISCYYLPFVFMIGNSIAQSAQPIISYNFGLGQSDRVRATIKASVTTAFICGAISTAAFVFCPEQLVRLFLNSADTAAPNSHRRAASLRYRIHILHPQPDDNRILSKHRESKAGNYFRTAPRSYIPAALGFLLLPRAAGNAGIWLAMPVSEILTSTAIAATFIIKNRLRKRY